MADVMTEWRERIAADYHASIARGEHDDKCEFDVRGFFLCHCDKRRREASGFTEPPTENLEFPPPDCPRCGEELRHEEGFVCDPCSLSWESDGRAASAHFTDTYGDDLAADAEQWRSKQPRPSDAEVEQVGEGK